MAIQLFVPTFRVEECLSEIKECLEKGWTGMGFKTVDFENKWKEYTRHPNAHYLNSATAGLHLAVKILKEQLGWEDNDEIVTTPLTFVSTNHAILYENLKPVFSDIDEYLCLDPKDVESKITEKTKAIMFVGMGGNIGRYYDIANLCKKYNLKLILDAAHMSGSRYNGDIVGKEADVVVYSFQAVKNLPTGDSGMICFKDKTYDDLARKYAWLGINKDTYSRTDSKGNYKWEYNIDYLGYKYNGNSIMAAIGLVGLKYLDHDNAYRRQIATWYNDNFKEYADKIKTIPIPDNCESSQHLYIIEVNNRDELLEKLNENEIYPGVHYKNNIEYSLYDYAKGTCPNTDRISHRILSLPIHMRLTKATVDHVTETVIRFAK
ncbi:MAG TPA: aminotransferase DegT [Clostridiales bacterium]|nr:MAG: aminotransferase DegT [Clostridiales bacterium GWD2_32_59]HAN10433.1 aminotransferase DegT [Clostridiales bacterium]